MLAGHPALAWPSLTLGSELMTALALLLAQSYAMCFRFHAMPFEMKPCNRRDSICVIQGSGDSSLINISDR